MKKDYVYGVPVFKFSSSFLGDDVDVFVSAGYHEIDGWSTPPATTVSTIDTITEYYDAVEELVSQKEKKRSGAV